MNDSRSASPLLSEHQGDCCEVCGKGVGHYPECRAVPLCSFVVGFRFEGFPECGKPAAGILDGRKLCSTHLALVEQKGWNLEKVEK